MKNNLLKLFLSGIIYFIFLFGFSFSIQSANLYDVFINEIAWMGTTESANNEWIELYNNTNISIDLNGWFLKWGEDTDKPKKIKLSGIILGNDFYLLERTDDKTVPNFQADQIYTGALNNRGENLRLYDNYGNLIDKIDCVSGWINGDKNTRQTMERVNSLSWQTSQNINGTPKTKNSILIEYIISDSQFNKNINPINKKQIKKETEKQENIEINNTENAKIIDKDFLSKGFADISGQSINNPFSGLYIFLIAFIIALVFGIMFLIFKKYLIK